MTADVAAIAALVAPGQSPEITSGGHEPLTLDQDALRARLDAGEADAVDDERIARARSLLACLGRSVPPLKRVVTSASEFEPYR